MDETMTRALLTRVLAEAPPPAAVDLDRVIRRAESERRRQIRLVIAAAAALVVVVTLTVAVLGPRITASRSAPPAARPPAGTTSSAAPDRFDPLHATLLVGEVPAGMSQRGTGFRTTGLYWYAGSERQGSLQASVGPRGVPLMEPMTLAKSKVAAGPTVHGHRSKWYSGGELGQSGYVLRWEWAPGAEARVALHGVLDPLSVATKAANSMTIDLKSPTRLPYTLQAPEGFSIQEFESATGIGQGPAASVAFGGPAKSFVSVNANLIGSTIGPTNTTYEGRKARVNQQSGTSGNGNTFVSVVMAASDLKITGTCNYRPNSTITLADFKALCLSTTASVKQTADLSKPGTWPRYAAK